MKRIITILIMCFLWLSCSDPIVGKVGNELDYTDPKGLSSIMNNLSRDTTKGSSNSERSTNLERKKNKRGVNEAMSKDHNGDDDIDENPGGGTTTGNVVKPPVDPVDPKPTVKTEKEKKEDLDHWQKLWKDMERIGNESPNVFKGSVKGFAENFRKIFSK